MFFRKGKGAGRGPAGEAAGPAAGGLPAAGGRPEPGLRLPPAPAEPALTLDNRGLQPPEPMVRILSALDQLQPGQVLQAHNDRKPMFLLPHLDERGFAYAMAEQDDGTVIIRIWRSEAAPAPDGDGLAPVPAEPARGAPATGSLSAGSGSDGGPVGGRAQRPQQQAGAAAQDGEQVSVPGNPSGQEAVQEAVEPLVMDVRPYFARRQEPFRDIMANVARLKPGQPFVLIVGFEPVPLYWVMKRKGFQHRAERGPDGAWRVTFWRPER